MDNVKHTVMSLNLSQNELLQK